MRRLALWLALLAGAPATGFAADLSVQPGDAAFVGRVKERRYPRELTVTAGDRSAVLRAVGSGVRKQVVFEVYEAVMYADTATVLAGDPYRTLVEGDFARRLEMHYLHSVDARRYRGALETGLDRVLGDAPRSPAFDDGLARFLAAMGESGVEEGDVVAITWLPGAGLFVTRNGKGGPPIPDPMLASTVMAIWFGAEPVSDTLKQDLVRLAVGDMPPSGSAGAPGR